RNPFRYKPAHQTEDGGSGLDPGITGGSGQVRTSGENAAYHSGARTARTHFKEKSHTVIEGGFDNAGEVNAVDRLGQNGVGGAFPVNLIRAPPGAAVESYPRR